MPSTILSDNGVTSGTAGIKTTGSNDGQLALQTTTAGGTATTALTIDTSQKVGIGTGSPAQPLEVASATGGTIGLRYLTNSGYATVGTDGNNNILFSIGNPPAEVGRFNSGGTLILKGGSTSATGTGITFPATQSASSDANTLDDYEEGTWTPVIDSATPGTGRVTTVNSAKYTKIGNVVTIHCYITMSTLGTGGSGTLKITGLPFTVAASLNYGGLSVPYSTNLNGNLVFIGCYAQTNTTELRITGQAAAGTTFDLITFATYVKANTDFIIGGSYFTS